jgi:hypothetical protein
MIDDALSVHPNYVALLGWQGGDALAFTQERPELVEKGLREMGYRFVPTAITLPETVHSDTKFVIASEWLNRGVGRAAQNYSMTLILEDSAGKLRPFDTGALPTREWIKGKTYAVRNGVELKGVPAGDYQGFITLIDLRSGTRVGLPLPDGKDKAYPIGQLHVR